MPTHPSIGCLRFCVRRWMCGLRAPIIAPPDKSMSFCPNCGTKLDGTGNFCNDCGAPVPVAAAVQPMEVQPTMPAQPTSDLRSQGAMFAVTVPANVAEGGQFQANTPNGPVLCTLPPA